MNKEFRFKEIDEEGLQTLETIADAHNFNRWMYETVAQHIIPGNILEIGSGIGNISRFFMDDHIPIVQSDLRENYCSFLVHKYGHHPFCQNILQLDIVHPEFDSVYAHLFESFDNVYALNVLEHIEDDQQAILNCHKLLRPGGRVIMLVPAYQSLYNGFDEELFHFRRYSQTQFQKLFQTADFHLSDTYHFNFMGILGWFVSGSLMRNRIIPSGQMQLYNYLVPTFRRIDEWVNGRVGLSLVCVGEKS